MASKTADSIRRRFNEKKKQVADSKQTLESMLHLPLVNIIFHLNFEKKTVFCEWVILNQAVYDELGVERGGLRAISQDRNNLIFRLFLFLLNTFRCRICFTSILIYYISNLR